MRDGSCQRGILGERHDRRTVSTRPKRKSKFVTCAERPARPSQRTKAPAQKEKARLDVCGAITDALPQKNPPNPRVFRYNIRIGK